jgi:hypothetical protein
MTRQDVVTAAKRLAQTPQAAGVKILLQDPDDYYLAVDQATAQLGRDKPNRTVQDLVLAASTYRIPLGGPGGLVTGWVDGVSYVTDVWSPFLNVQDEVPNDPNTWRLAAGPGGVTNLELLDHTAQAGSTVRVGIVLPWAVTDVAGTTTILAGHQRAFEALAAYYVLTMAANLAVQNTGASGLPNDIVDRRTQSDIFRSRAKDLLGIYGSLIGIPGAGTDKANGSVAPASATKDLDVPAGNPWGFLWHGAGTR